ncbi:unnamed protein product, partial [Polarella glacialis]
AAQIYGFVFTLRSPTSYYGNVWNYLDQMFIALLNVVVLRALFSGDYRLDYWPELFAVVVLGRWIQLLFTLRAFRLGNVGVKGIIPILYSVKKIGGMMIICGFVFAGFLHAFLALDHGVSGTPWSTVVATMKLLFTVDGEGIEHVLKLGGRGGPDGDGDYLTAAFFMVAVIIFCISLLNLFIAVHSKAYAEAHERSMALFLQERAAICLHCMMQPKMMPLQMLSHVPVFKKCCTSRYATESTAVLAVLCAGLWAYLITVDSCPPVIPALLLLAAVLMTNCLLLRRPWSKDEEDKSYLWWCAPTHMGNLDQDMDVSINGPLEAIAERLVRIEMAMKEQSQTLQTLAQHQAHLQELLPEDRRAERFGKQGSRGQLRRGVTRMTPVKSEGSHSSSKPSG